MSQTCPRLWPKNAPNGAPDMPQAVNVRRRTEVLHILKQSFTHFGLIRFLNLCNNSLNYWLNWVAFHQPSVIRSREDPCAIGLRRQGSNQCAAPHCTNSLWHVQLPLKGFLLEVSIAMWLFDLLINHFFGRLQIVCYENSSQLSSRVLLPQHGGDIIFQVCNAKSAPAIIGARYINTQKYKFSHCCIFRVLRNYIGGTHHESAIRIQKDFQFWQSLGGPLAISILTIFTQPWSGFPGLSPMSSVCMQTEISMSNVMKRQMSWNVKCHEM